MLGMGGMGGMSGTGRAGSKASGRRKGARELYCIMELKDTSNLVFADPTSWWPHEGEAETLSPFFAAGRVVTSSMLSTLLCQTFFNPNIGPILRSLISGPSALMHLPVPADCKTYHDVFRHFMGLGMLPVALYAHPRSVSAREVRSTAINYEYIICYIYIYIYTHVW